VVNLVVLGCVLRATTKKGQLYRGRKVHSHQRKSWLCWIPHGFATVVELLINLRLDRIVVSVSTGPAAVTDNEKPSGPTRACRSSGTEIRERRTVFGRGRSSAVVPGAAGSESRVARIRRSDWWLPACSRPSGSS